MRLRKFVSIALMLCITVLHISLLANASAPDEVSSDYLEPEIANTRVVDKSGRIISEPELVLERYLLADVINNNKYSVDGTMIAGIYKDGKLLDVVIDETFSALAGQVTPCKIDLTCADIQKGSSIKLMFWKDMQNLKPLCDLLAIKFDEDIEYGRENFENGFQMMWETTGSGLDQFTLTDGESYALLATDSSGSLMLADIVTDTGLTAMVNVDAASAGRLMFKLRNFNHRWFGEYCYLVGFEDCNTIAIVKRSFNGKATVEKTLATKDLEGNGFSGIITAKAMDNNISLCLNGSEELSVIDETAPILKGRSGIFLDGATGYIDSFSAVKLADASGGDLDNMIPGGFSKSTDELVVIYY